MYEIDTSRDKSRDFDLSVTHFLTDCKIIAYYI
jgi:hypothetical protein